MCAPELTWKSIHCKSILFGSPSQEGFEIVAKRSDNHIIKALVDKAKFDDSSASTGLVSAIRILESYRTCQCPENPKCHKPNPIRRTH